MHRLSKSLLTLLIITLPALTARADDEGDARRAKAEASQARAEAAQKRNGLKVLIFRLKEKLADPNLPPEADKELAQRMLRAAELALKEGEKRGKKGYDLFDEANKLMKLGAWPVARDVFEEAKGYFEDSGRIFGLGIKYAERGIKALSPQPKPPGGDDPGDGGGGGGNPPGEPGSGDPGGS